MTQKDSRDFDPKHRVIGAIIVVSLAVIFVPMILDRREAPTELSAPEHGRAPGTQSGDTKVVVTPVRPEPSNQADKIETAPSPTPNPARSAPPPVAATPLPPATVVKPAVKPAEPKAADVKAGWVVQVGTFSSTTNAARLEEQLKKLGHAVKAERIAIERGNATRLRVGPFRDKSLAVKAQGQIEKQIGVHGVVLAYP